ILTFMIIDPRTTLEYSRAGALLWFNSVLPALFPFFVLCELMIPLGIVSLLGIMLEPVMRPLFNLPGESSFAVAMGFVSGFPMGAILSRRLLDEQLVTPGEASRLAAFTNNASPLFILGYVGVGLFGSPEVGYLLAGAHYMSNLMIGIFLGFKRPRIYSSVSINVGKEIKAALQLTASNLKNPGALLGISITNALINIAKIGGFVVVFSVITGLLSAWGVIPAAGRILQVFGLSYSSGVGMGVGLFEMTLGAKSLALSQGGSLERLVAVSIILAWTGLSIQSQILSIIAGSSIRFAVYFKARLIQPVIASVLLYIGCLIHPISITSMTANPTMAFLPDGFFMCAFTSLETALFAIVLWFAFSFSALIFMTIWKLTFRT
ncbi:MAG: nucleoside recognition domain-containing protein, partial [Candidatus Saccharibacteria bacterium]